LFFDDSQERLMLRTRAVFISSTFVDMQAERDYLRTRVFPELEERLRLHRYSLEWVDLRVGVATASQLDEHVREMHVLKVCLDEVRRCRPFLIVLLGDRYGWVPPEHRIKGAAEEAQEGFSSGVVGRSVTDLEIDFGVFSEPDQQTRSFFYIREPLPYGEMPPKIAVLYSDACDMDPAAADRVSRLDALKTRIELRLPERVRRYALEWDAERQRPTGLEAWGSVVIEDIWSELEAEIRQGEAEPEISWQQAERDALEDFVDDRARNFVGREDILSRLTGPATGAESAGVPAGVCVSSDPGSGKSALFGELYRRLRDSDVLLLAHAAGASVQAASIDSMLRRWISELGTALGTDPALEEKADPDTIDATFASLLGKIVLHRHVVLLIDALDQFEDTTRARYLTWLPRKLPANARLVATAIPGTSSGELADRGMEVLPLLPLDVAEAHHIAQAICNRYHRTFEPEVINALLAKGVSDQPAWGNALWLVLAVEELNLLDADDFARAQRAYAGEPGVRLRALMVDIVESFPLDLSGLYNHLFTRVEDLFGTGLVRGFLGLIAAGRAGWRESDFRIVLPQASGEPWDELKFAQLRRFFRGQMRRRGSLGRWDFNHGQMRHAVRSRLGVAGIPERSLHAIIVDRLLSCPPDDALRISETMVHLLGSEDWTRAADYYGGASLTEAEVREATRVLADRLIQTRADDHAQEVQVLRNLLDCSASSEVHGRVADRLFLKLCSRIINRTSSNVRLSVYELLREIFEAEVKSNPDDEHLQANFALCLDGIGTLMKSQGRHNEARQNFLSSVHIMEKLIDGGSLSSDGYMSSMADSYLSIGDIYVDQGQPEAAIGTFREVRRVAQRLVTDYPEITSLRHYLTAAELKLGGALEKSGQLDDAISHYRTALRLLEQLSTEEPKCLLWQSNAALAHSSIGNALREQGVLTLSIVSRKASRQIRERLAAADPSDWKLQREWAASIVEIGEVLLDQDQIDEALLNLHDARVIFERLAATDPSNIDRQDDLLVCLYKTGDVQLRGGRFADALTTFEAGMLISERLVAEDSNSVLGCQNLCSGSLLLGNVLYAQGRFEEALERYRASLAMQRRLIDGNTLNTKLQHSLSALYLNIGNALLQQKKLDDSLQSFREASAIAARLGESDPSDIRWQRSLSLVQGRIGIVLEAQGLLHEALASFRVQRQICKNLAVAHPDNRRLQQDAIASHRESLALEKRIAEAEPDNPRRQLDLAVSHEELGDMLIGRSDSFEAISSYFAALLVRRSLEKAVTNRDGGRLGRIALHDKMGDIFVRLGRLEEALANFRATATMEEALAAADPDNDILQSNLSISHDKIGGILTQQGKFPEALESLGDALAIRKKLATAAPDDAGRQHNQLASLEKIGKVLVTRGDLSAARDYFQKGVAIANRLMSADRENIGWLNRLAAFWFSIGEIDAQEEDYENARKSFEFSVILRSGVAATEPHDTDWQELLSASHERTGTMQLLTNDLASGLRSFQQCNEIMNSLVKFDPDNVAWQYELARSYFKLTISYMETKDPMEARAAAHFGRTILTDLLERFPDKAALWKGELARFVPLIEALRA
jgi:tetratricopeptide (TPR) repeat protein